MMTMRGALLLLAIIFLVGLGYVAARQLGLVRGAGSGTASIELVLEADAGDLGGSRAGADKALDDAREIIASRVDALDARETSVSRQGTNRIFVRVDGIKNPAAVRAMILATGRVELRQVDQDVAEDRIERGRAPPGSEILSYSAVEGEEPDRIAVHRRAVVTSNMIKDARQRFDESGTPVLAISLTAEGARQLARATTENVGKPLAFLLDDAVLSEPMIWEPITDGMVQFNADFTVESANDLALLINSGALPVRLKVVGEKIPARPRPD